MPFPTSPEVPAADCSPLAERDGWATDFQEKPPHPSCRQEVPGHPPLVG
jgi:hypothetical protein